MRDSGTQTALRVLWGKISLGTQIVLLLALVNAGLIVLIMVAVATWPWTPVIVTALVVIRLLTIWGEKHLPY